MNTGLMTAMSTLSFEDARRERDLWGRLVESAVGAHLINNTWRTSTELFYWRERNREVDFILRAGRRAVAIEVKSGYAKGSFPGMEALSKQFRIQRKLLVGAGGIGVEDFLLKPVADWLA